MIGAFWNDGGGAQAGAAYLIYGQAADLADITLSAANSSKFVGEVAGDYAGGSVSSAGDVNGDGYDDLMTGATKNDGGGADAGAVYLIYGQAAELADITLSAVTTVKFTGEAANDGARDSSPAGDVNNDGYDDIVLEIFSNDGNGLNSGAAYLIYGQAVNLADITLSAATAIKFTGEAAGDRFARYSAAGDVNNDGYDDVLISATEHDGAGSDSGAAYLIFGQDTDLADITVSAANTYKFIGEEIEDYAGAPAVGDVNNDNYYDVIIGSYGNDAGGDWAGAVYLGYIYFDADGDNVPGTDGLMDSTDCNDNDAAVSANQTYYYDYDGDGKGNPLNTTSLCSATAPAGYVTDNTDTNDDIATSTISDISFNEDNTSTITLSTYFTQRESLALTYSLLDTDTPDNITVTIDGSTATLTPEENWYGTDTITFNATDSNGVSKNSNQINLTVNNVNDTPNKVTSGFSPNNEEVGTTKPTLSWTAPTDSDNTSSELTYHVRVSTNSDPITNNQYSYTSNIGTASLKVTDALSEETTYYWSVRVSDPSSAKSDWSTIKSFTVNTALPPEISLSKVVTISTGPFSFINILIKQANAESTANYYFRTIKKNIYSITFILLFLSFALFFFISLPNIEKSKYLSLGNKASAVFSAITMIVFALSWQINPASIAADDNGETIEPNEYIQYTITAENTGDLSASNTVITDTIPADTTLQANTPTSSNENTVITTNGSNITFTTPSIGQDKTLTISYVVRINNPCSSSQIDSASASFTSDEDVSASSNTVSNPVESSGLKLTLNNTRGFPIADAKATLSQNNTTLLTDTSDVAGQLNFSGLASGTYSVSIDGPDYYNFQYTGNFTLQSGAILESTLTLSPEIVEQEEQVATETEEETETIPPTEETEYIAVKIGEQEYQVPTNIKQPLTDEEKQALKDQMEMFLKLLMVNDQAVEDGDYFEAIFSTVPGVEEYRDEQGNLKPIIKLSGNELVLKGLTLPNAVVTITIKSDPIVRVIQADQFGKWELRVPMELLPPGEHTIYAQSELYGVTTDQIILGKFTVPQEKKQLSRTAWLFIINLFIIVGLAIFIFFFMQRKKMKLAKIQTRQKR
ncbi:MAG: hypothetical protein WC752_01245 [Patescibacteria group bacterium]|jgi:uncharacterized repeat protein (TIGR01451 family)